MSFFMIISRGLGFLVAVIVFGSSLIANIITDAACGKGYYDRHKWPFAVSLVLSASICWILGNSIKKRSDRVVIDKATGKEFTINRHRHTLFFIPMHWWGPILFVIAMVLFVRHFSR